MQCEDDHQIQEMTAIFMTDIYPAPPAAFVYSASEKCEMNIWIWDK